MSTPWKLAQSCGFGGAPQQAEFFKFSDYGKFEKCAGFGAVIVKDGKIIASSHDREDTNTDPTSHAEINVIREASRILNKDFSDCMLLSTHEPCPMCACAIVWSGITTIAYGCSIKETVLQKRTRIDFPCEEFFDRAKANIKIYSGIMENECSILYRKDVRQEIKNLRNADDMILATLNADSINRRITWFHDNKSNFDFIDNDLLNSGYRLLLERLHISPEDAPVVSKTDTEIVFHSQNFCPTLEACKILGLDTRYVCQRLNETSTDGLIKQIDSRLVFSRNYNKLRPHANCCEEMITLVP